MAERRNFVRLVLLHLSADSGGQNFFVLGGKLMKKRLLALLLVLTADSFFTVRLLRRTHNVDLLGLPNLLASLR